MDTLGIPCVFLVINSALTVGISGGLPLGGHWVGLRDGLWWPLGGPLVAYASLSVSICRPTMRPLHVPVSHHEVLS